MNKDYKVTGPWPPLWLGPKEIGLLATHHDRVTLIAFYGEHFAKSRVLADTSTVNGGKILDMAVSHDGMRLAIAVASNNKLQIWTRDTQEDSPASVAATMDEACDKAGVAWLGPETVAVGAECAPSAAARPLRNRPQLPGKPRCPKCR